MLSKGAFNALLKTLEEPPEHVKFIFATTEIRKVPVTVLSRCQRFDLRRVDVPVLVAHFKRIVADGRRHGRRRRAGADRARRRGLACATACRSSTRRSPLGVGRHGARHDDGVRAMLGLADRGPHLRSARARARAATPARRSRRSTRLHQDGADPVAGARRPRRGRAYRDARQGRRRRGGGRRRCRPRSGARAAALAGELSMPLLARAWQMLLKGLEEAGRAPNPLRRRRDGADPHRPHGRPAAARRDHPHARRRSAACARRARHRARRHADAPAPLNTAAPRSASPAGARPQAAADAAAAAEPATPTGSMPRRSELRPTMSRSRRGRPDRCARSPARRRSALVRRGGRLAGHGAMRGSRCTSRST